jgi:hypothetical protein
MRLISARSISLDSIPLRVTKHEIFFVEFFMKSKPAWIDVLEFKKTELFLSLRPILFEDGVRYQFAILYAEHTLSVCYYMLSVSYRKASHSLILRFNFE